MRKKNEDPIGDFIFLSMVRGIFSAAVFPILYIKVGYQGLKTLVACLLMLHERKEFKHDNSRYADIPKGMTWTNPKFLSEDEILKQNEIILRKTKYKKI